MSATRSDAALVFDGVGLVRGDRTILDAVDWAVRTGERWVVLGRNGSGKTSLVRLAAGHLHPTRGRVEVLGEVVGRTDLRRLRPRIGLASSALAKELRSGVRAIDVVLTGKHAALEPWWHRYDDSDRARALELLSGLGVASLASQELATLSSGEAQRVQLARTLMGDPGLVLLDEPTAGLDLAGREELVGALSAVAVDAAAPPLVLVTHHLDEVPPGFTHALLVRAGRVHAAGALDDVLTADSLSSCFDLALQIERRGDRWSAWAAPGA